jgi:hypothetical protein
MINAPILVGFTEHIFPTQSRPFLSLTANIGLCLFLFLIGLEIDAGVIKRNAKLSATVALAGMSIPFGLGFALALPLHDEFIGDDVKYTYFGKNPLVLSITPEAYGLILQHFLPVSHFPSPHSPSCVEFLPNSSFSTRRSASLYFPREWGTIS